MTMHDEFDHKFDQQARAHYRDAASMLSPALQGRLRAARRTASAGAWQAAQDKPARRHGYWQALPIAVVAASVFALAIGPRLERGTDPSTEPMANSAGPSIASPHVADEQSVGPLRASAPVLDETLLLMLDEDPDFYLWLGSDDPLPATLEPRHDPS